MEVILEVLKFLSSPFEKDHTDEWKVQQTDNAETLINAIVERCREKIQLAEISQKIITDGSSSPSWKLTITVLDVLLKLRDEVLELERNQPEEHKSIETLSLQAQVNIQKCVELVVGFGILPYLLPNVGIPVKIRKKNIIASELFLQQDHHLLPLIKFNRLAQVLDMLLEIGTHPSFHVLIIPRHCADILAALIQIVKVPIAKPNSTLDSLNEVEYSYVMSLRQRFQLHFDTFLEVAPKSLLVSSLFLIGEKPKFMQLACIEEINKILHQTPNGLILITSTLLSEVSATNVWNLAKNVSTLMKNAFKFPSKEEDGKFSDLFSNMCTQCIDMILSIHNGNISESNQDTSLEKEGQKKKSTASSSSAPFAVHKELSRIGLYCSLVLMDINYEKCKLLVWDRLFNPVLLLMSLGDGQHIGSEGSISQPHHSHEETLISVDVQKVMIAADIADGLLSLVIPLGISIPIFSFQPLWSLLFEIYVTCKQYLELKIQEHSVSLLAESLKCRLENLFFTLIEIVNSVGCSDKLNLGTASTRESSGGNGNAGVSDKDKKIIDNGNMFCPPHAICTFCIELLMHEKKKIPGYGDTLLLKSLPILKTPNEVISQDSSESMHNERVQECVKIVREKSGGQFPAALSSSGDFDRTEDCEFSNDVSDDIDNAFELLEEQCKTLCSILKDERVSHVATVLFRELLNYENENFIRKEESGNCLRTENLTFEQEIKSSTLSSSSSWPTGATGESQELTQLELEENIMKEKSRRKFIALKLLSELGEDETTVENVVKTADDYKDTLLIVELVMKKLAKELKDSSCTGESYEFTQSIVFALGFLGTIVETATFSSSSVESSKLPAQNNSGEIWNELIRFTPHLKIIAESDNLRLVNSGITSMAENILVGITTRGKGLEKDKKGKKKTLMNNSISRYEKALEDVSNSMLPIKGHGLLQLRRLIEEKDPDTLKNDAKLLVIFQEELSNEDSYVYLMAIQGLASLGLKFHHLIIPVLIQEYDFINPIPPGDTTRSTKTTTDNTNGCRREKMYRNMTQSERIECRMKIGEVLVKIIQKLGDIAPMYRVPLTNLFFRLVRDDESLIKASALSNLGELCHLLKFSLGVVLTEVWYNVESILNCEKDTSVRRAALHLIVLLLKGVEKEFTSNYLLTDVELGSHLRDVRRLLTRIEQNESDSVAKTHAQLALNELGLIARKILAQPTNEELLYKIRITNSLE